MPRRSQPGLLVSLLILAWSGLAELDHSAVAASAKPKRVTKSSTAQPGHVDRPLLQESIETRRTTARHDETEQRAMAERRNSRPTDRVVRFHGRLKHTKKFRRSASAQSKPDLSYHGMLEQPGRYDPSPARRKGGVPNPQAGDLRYDHFQELDRNRDGVIDPFERVSGRLDIDRDLAQRQRE